MGQFFEELKRRNVLRVAIAYLAVSWLLIQVADTIFPAYGLSDSALTILITILAIGFIPALVLAWVFELTPQGVKRDQDVDRSTPASVAAGKNLDRLIIVVLVLALGYFAVDKFVLDPARDVELVEEATLQGRTQALVDSYGEKSIAVLPFVNMSDDARNEYFSDGISEELLYLLSKIPKLRVISRSSSFSFKGKDIDVSTIARQLNVAYVLEGSVRRDGDRLRITAQLIEARSDTHLWSETYDRELADIFEIQDDISAAIVGALEEILRLDVDTAPRATRAANTEAHEAYLRGRYLVAQRTPVSIEGAIREFEKAITLDPDYALPHAELAVATLLLMQNRGLTRAEVVARASPHAERAMALDPTLAEAQAATGFLLWIRRDLEEALAHFRQAIQINPNYSDANTWLAILLDANLGRYEEAFVAFEAAVQLDPMSIHAKSNYVEELIHRNRLAEADTELEKLALIGPYQYAQTRGLLMSLGGQWKNLALSQLDSMLVAPEGGSTRIPLARDLAMIGIEYEALALFEPARTDVLRILGRYEDAVAAIDAISSRTELVRVLAGAGLDARALPILEDEWQKNGRRVIWNSRFDIDAAAALVRARRSANDESGASEIVEAIRDNVRRYRKAGSTVATVHFSADYEEGLAYILSGEGDTGLALIRKAAEEGFFIPSNAAYLEVLYDNPGFAQIEERQSARRTRERERFLNIVCTDNPYEAVWQPDERTCERFAAAGGK